MWMLVLSVFIREDGGELSPPLRSPFEFGTPLQKAWLVNFVAMFFWLFDGTCLGGTAKYLNINVAEVTPGAHTAMQFFMVCMVLNLFNLIFAATYANFAQMRVGKCPATRRIL